MAKYVKCVDNSGIPSTEGNCYAVVNSDRICYSLTDDQGVLSWWNKGMFEEPYDLPEPITFASQEDFENAVMELVVRRLGVVIDNKATPYGNSKAYLQIEEMI